MTLDSFSKVLSPSELNNAIQQSEAIIAEDECCTFFER
jgi:hypothetical protein